MRFHVIGLRHTEITQEYNQCAYTAKVRKFATMMTRRGHEVFLYSSGRSDAEVTEHIEIFTRDQQAEQFETYPWWNNREWFGLDWDDTLPYWQKFNGRVIGELYQRIQPQDFVCLITGIPQRIIADSFPNHITAEYGV